MKIQIYPQTYQYPDLISKIEQGFVKIPAFQRDFVWSMDKTLFLIDSISRRYPIGMFLFWQSSDYIHSLRNIGNLNIEDPPTGHPVQYILDGQQRITSLFVALKGAQINGYAYHICLDLDSTPENEEIFFAREPDGERYVLLSDLLGNDHGDLYASLTQERRRRFNEVRDTFRNYTFSVTRVEGGDLDIICDLFDRINNTGTELSVFDLLVARTWSPSDESTGVEEFDLRKSFEYLTNDLARVGFDEIPEPVMAQLAGAIIKSDCSRKGILTIGREEMREAWPDLVKSLHSAVDFVRKKIRVKATRLLPYPTLLVPFSYFFFKNEFRNPDGRQSAWLTRYFYVNGFAQRLSSGTQSKLTEDIHIIDDLVAGRPATFDAPLSVSAQDIQAKELRIGNAYCKSVLCLLAARRPLDLRDASDVILDNQYLQRANSRHFHHIFPRGYLRGKMGAEEANSVANIALIPADLNLKIGAKAPSKYLVQFVSDNHKWDDTLKSHGIMGDSRKALDDDEFLQFLQKRAKALSDFAKAVLNPI